MTDPAVLPASDPVAASLRADDRREEMLAVLHDIFRKIWVEERDDLFDAYYHPDARFQGIDPAEEIGLQDFKDLVTEFRRHQRMIDYAIVDLISDGVSRCAARIQYQVYIEAAETEACLQVETYYTIVDGRVKHLHVMIDRLGLLEQIGAMPEGSYFIGLSGGRFS